MHDIYMYVCNHGKTISATCKGQKVGYGAGNSFGGFRYLHFSSDAFMKKL